MAEPSQFSAGLVAQRVRQIDGGDGLARLSRKALPAKEAGRILRPPAFAPALCADGKEAAAAQATADTHGPTGSAGPSPRGLPMTPREAPAPGAGRVLGPAGSLEARRRSRISFAEDCGLAMDSDSGGSIAALSDSEAEAAVNAGEGGLVSTFALDDSDEEDAGDDGIDGEYDFDHEKLAEMVKAGADRQKLAQVVEEAMASALERKLARRAGKDLRDAAGLAGASAEAAAAARGDAWNLEGRMTPGRMTPTQESGAVPVPIDVSSVAQRAQEALARANDRRRRSSAARKHVPAITQAMNEAKERRRRSLAKRTDAQGGTSDQIQQAMARARGRHRQSLSKVADVLESAGYAEDDAEEGEVAAKMRLVQRAMEDARQRHRRSIARAVQELEEPIVGPVLNADAQTFEPRLQYVEQPCSGAGMEGQHANWGQTPSLSQAPILNADAQWGSPSMGDWGGASFSSAQVRINQAVSSAYHDHCFQQTGEQCYSQLAYIDQAQCAPPSEQMYGQESYPDQASLNYAHTQHCYSQQDCVQVPCEQAYEQSRVVQHVQGTYQQDCFQQEQTPQTLCDYGQHAHPQASQHRYQQDVVFHPQPCCQQYDVQCGHGAFQQQMTSQIACDQPSHEYHASAYHSGQCQNMAGTIMGATQCGSMPPSDTCAWQYGVQDGSSAWNESGPKCIAGGCWEGQQVYSAPWRLGAA